MITQMNIISQLIKNFRILVNDIFIKIYSIQIKKVYMSEYRFKFIKSGVYS